MKTDHKLAKDYAKAVENFFKERDSEQTIRFKEALNGPAPIEADFSGYATVVEEKLNLAKYNTTVDVKRQHFSKFADLIANQFNHGGDKYKLNNDKEFTDQICETFPGESGVDFVLSTCMKYLGRYKNFGREKDLLKIATYCYILWLKNGNHLKEEHDEDVKR